MRAIGAQHVDSAGRDIATYGVAGASKCTDLRLVLGAGLTSEVFEHNVADGQW